MKRKVLVVDIGGSHIKLMLSADEKLKFDSGLDMTPRDFARRFKDAAKDLKYSHVSIGFPAPVREGKIANDPKHLGKGWIGFDFRAALGAPARVINDAAMQALGSHVRGRTLFLGLGTGLGSALVWDKNVLPLELGDLPYRGRRKIEDFLGKKGFERAGKRAWSDEVLYAVAQLKISFIVDSVVLGGGLVNEMQHLPRGVERGDNRNAYLGGCRLWETDRAGKTRWQIL
jgi:predicted NBD/HSP70 family sugar kinase